MSDVYVCFTYFHVYITLIKTLKTKNKVTIVLSNNIPTQEQLCSILKESNLFSNVLKYDEIDAHKEFLEQKIETKIFRKKEINEIYNKYSNINFKVFDNIYVYNDWTTIGAYLIDNNIKYHLIEDGIDSFYYLKGNLRNIRTFLNPNLKYRIRHLIKKILHMGYDYFGQSRQVIDIEVNDIDKIDIKNRKFKEVSKKSLYNSLTNEDKKIIYNIFMNESIETNTKNNILILTQPLYIDKMVDTLEQQIHIYKNMINKYSNYNIYIKPHPRDTYDYKQIDKNLIIIDKNIPIEILNFNDKIRFEKAITITSSSIKDLNFVDEKIEYGFSYLDRIKEESK